MRGRLRQLFRVPQEDRVGDPVEMVVHRLDEEAAPPSGKTRFRLLKKWVAKTLPFIQ
jgi:hypothetical protein